MGSARRTTASARYASPGAGRTSASPLFGHSAVTYTRAVIDDWQAGKNAFSQVAIAKNTAMAACEFVVTDAVRLHGGMGYVRETRWSGTAATAASSASAAGRTRS